MTRIESALVALCLASLLASCTSTPPSAQDIPRSWVAIPSREGCQSLSGTYRASGLSAPGNEQPQATVSWPSASGSLITLIAPGADMGPVDDVRTIRIESSAAGDVAFRALRYEGDAELSSSRKWACSSGALSGVATLQAADAARSANTRYESSVRLWKSADGALITEETIESVARHRRRSSLIRRKLATRYFRFDAATPQVSGEPAVSRLSE